MFWEERFVKKEELLWVRLGTTYLAEIENFLLKILLIKVKANWNSTVGLMNSTKKYSGTHE